MTQLAKTLRQKAFRSLKLRNWKSNKKKKTKSKRSRQCLQQWKRQKLKPNSQRLKLRSAKLSRNLKKAPRLRARVVEKMAIILFQMGAGAKARWQIANQLRRVLTHTNAIGIRKPRGKIKSGQNGGRLLSGGRAPRKTQTGSFPREVEVIEAEVEAGIVLSRMVQVKPPNQSQKRIMLQVTKNHGDVKPMRAETRIQHASAPGSACVGCMQTSS
mmetsp:Transcript_119411/g.187339  ORF Transcript_119411/g.187339 Transcript_119411/m.187339 type:complete len:214 (+) Transcript_119411:839-1480(+)